jgi:DNA repair protein RecO (recombination protein O)
MSGTYIATGINLKAAPMGENDRLITVLTQEYGLLRAIAPGSRKPKSSLGGRMSLFVVNQLAIVKGRSIDRIIQAETLNSYAGLARDLDKLTASQYLAEIVLAQALTELPQAEIFQLLNFHLARIELLTDGDRSTIMAHLCHGIFHLLALGGIAPQIHHCILTKQSIEPNLTDDRWRIAYSIDGGGIADPVILAEEPSCTRSHLLTAPELFLLQQLSDKNLGRLATEYHQISHWQKIEKLLRQYIKYHLNLSIASAALISS